jgi:uncharacterized protein (UPF0332 family)
LGLLEKSLNNKHCREWAFNIGYFDVAVSRLYYSLYQKLVYLNTKLKLGVPNKDKSHDDFICEIIEKLYEQKYFINETEITEFTILTQLRGKRNKADYYESMISLSEYKFAKESADRIEVIIDRLLGKN